MQDVAIRGDGRLKNQVVSRVWHEGKLRGCVADWMEVDVVNGD
jgi:hypothetical protein